MEHFDDFKRVRRIALLQAGHQPGESVTQSVMDRLNAVHQNFFMQYMANISNPLFSDSGPDQLYKLKKRSTRINVLSLFSGIIPEAKALLDLGFTVRMYVMDLDHIALGVAMAEYANNPNVEFFTIKVKDCKFGDILGLYKNSAQVIQAVQRHCGGIHLVIATPPCTTFSLAGNGAGCEVGTGTLFAKTKVITDRCESTGGPTFLLVENTNTSNKNKTEQQNTSASWPNPILAQGANTSAFRRSRYAWLNYPPSCELDLDGTKPDRLASHMFGTLCSDLIINKRRKKFNTIIHTKSALPDFGIYRIKDESGDVLSVPKRVKATVEQVTYMFGYEREDWRTRSYGKNSAGPGIMNRWNDHDVDTNGFIVDLRGVGNDDDALKELSSSERMALLGNSVLPGMMRDLLKSLKQLFPSSDSPTVLDR